MAEAPIVRVASGQELGELEIRMARSRTYRISGMVLDSQGRPAASAQLELAYEMSGGTMRGSGGMAKPDGTFEFASLSPGDYVVTARPMGSSLTSGGESSPPVRVTVAGADVENVTLAMSPGVTVTGQILSVDGAVPAFRPAGLQLIARPALPGAGAFGFRSRSAVADDWTFELTGVQPVPLLFRFNGQVPGGYRFWSVIHRGADITDTPTAFTEPVSGRDLQIIITDRGASLSGVVTDAAGRPIVRARIHLFAVETELRTVEATRTRLALSDENGRYEMEGLRAGSYYLVAWEGPSVDPREPAQLERLVPHATPVTLREDEARTVNLRVAKIEGG